MLFQRSGGPRSKPVFATLKARVIWIVLGAVFRVGLFVLRGQTILGDMRMMRAIPSRNSRYMKFVMRAISHIVAWDYCISQ
jgi:hypothetical protein